MDEPTNDLDVETLELLEELLIEYSGTLILVSHDRAFLNNVVTSTMVLEKDGIINEYSGGYDDWLNQTKGQAVVPQPKEKPIKEVIVREIVREKRALSNKEERELESLVGKIERFESQREEIYEQMAQPDFYQKDPKEIATVKARLETLEDDLLAVFERWEYLESLKSGSEQRTE